jgi:hypothetical protein
VCLAQASNNVVFSYLPPSLHAIDPFVIPTDGLELVRLTGTNFGTRGAIVTVVFPNTSMTVYPNADRLTNTTGDPVTYVRQLKPAPCTVVSQSHTVIEVVFPGGMGLGVQLQLSVGTSANNGSVQLASSAPILFNYATPTITEVLPNIANAHGARMRLFGDNFGFVSLERLAVGGVLPSPVVHLNGRPCTQAVLLVSQDYFDRRPYIDCVAQDDIVGRKNISLVIAFQSTYIDVRRSKVGCCVHVCVSLCVSVLCFRLLHVVGDARCSRTFYQRRVTSPRGFRCTPSALPATTVASASSASRARLEQVCHVYYVVLSVAEPSLLVCCVLHVRVSCDRCLALWLQCATGASWNHERCRASTSATTPQ